jgi:hypothetical protein
VAESRQNCGRNEAAEEDEEADGWKKRIGLTDSAIFGRALLIDGLGQFWKLGDFEEDKEDLAV